MPLTFIARYFTVAAAPTMVPEKVFANIDNASVRLYTTHSFTQVTVYYFGFFK